MGTIRYECTAAGFEHNWAEISDRWKRREIVAYGDRDGDDETVIGILREKIGDCHLESDDGVIERGEDLTADAIMGMDVTVYGFLLQLPFKVVARRQLVGNVSARSLSPALDKAAPNPTE
jgi:hypothetical protein